MTHIEVELHATETDVIDRLVDEPARGADRRTGAVVECASGDQFRHERATRTSAQAVAEALATPGATRTATVPVLGPASLTDRSGTGGLPWGPP
jgi:hypothetical protein